MDRARRAALATILVVVALGLGLAVAGGSGGRMLWSRTAAAVTWPISTLLLSEVQTGGASASDEFVELTNAGPSAVDLVGLEVVYVTSSGGTITRKASWSASTALDPGRHLLLANSLGIHASIADAVYSGGLAATGGSLVLRAIGGSPIDAIGWGDATNNDVEGTAAVAPPAGSSIERRPGGIDGNSTDSNDNRADWFVQSAPSPQSLAAPPVPVPGPTFTPPAASGTPPPPSASPTPGASASATLPATATPPASAPPAPSSSLLPTAAPSGEPTTSPSGTPASSASPSPSAGPSAGPSGQPSAAPSSQPSDSPAPTEAPSPTPSPTAMASSTTTPGPDRSGSPGASATPVPSASTAPTASPMPTPTLSPTPSPTPTPAPSVSPVLAIADARLLPDGSVATVEGVLTTPLGLLEDGRTAFIEDGRAGLAIYLDMAPAALVPTGTLVRVSGSLDDRYSQRTLRATLAAVTAVDSAPLPVPITISTGSATEPLEGRRVAVTGWTVGSPTIYADGTGVLLDDGSGGVRAIVGSDALGGQAVPAGTLVTVMGPLGQRDSTGSGTTGYRIYATQPGELAVIAVGPSPSPSTSPPPSVSPEPTPTWSPPTATPGPTPSPGSTPSAAPLPSTSLPPLPTPTPTPTPSPTPTPIPTPTPTPTSTPTAAPTPTPTLRTIADARVQSIGAALSVGGVVTAEAGRLGTPALLALEDGTGGLVIRLADGMPAPSRGTHVEVSGVLGAPYGQLELNLDRGSLRVLDPGFLPVPLPARASTIGEATEARLVVVEGTVAAAPVRSTSNDISFDVVDVDGSRVRVMADASSGLATTIVRTGTAYRLTGVVGQRASRKGALDGYRVWLRDSQDVVTVAARVGSSGSPLAGSMVQPIAAVIGALDASVVIEGTVTGPAMLLDQTGRRIVVQDPSGACEVLLPVGSVAPAVGQRVRIAGVVGRAYGAPRLRATAVDLAAQATDPSVLSLAGQPGSALEWRLVRVAGRIASVTRLGSRWRAEVELAGDRILVDGLPGAAIPSTAVVIGREASIVGIVRRAYPGATDQRFSVVPRGLADLRFATGSRVAPDGSTATDGSGSAGRAAAGDRAGSALLAAADVDLATLRDHPGELVRVGGLVVEPQPDGFSLDDGTAVGRVRLTGEAVAYVGLLEPGDAVNAIGIVGEADAREDAWEVIVSAADGLVRIGDLGQPATLGRPNEDPGPSTTAAPAAMPSRDADSGGFGLSAFLPADVDLTAGFASIVVFVALSLAAPLLRRWRIRRARAARLAARLAALGRTASNVS